MAAGASDQLKEAPILVGPHQAAACPSSRILKVMPALRSRSTSSMPMAAGSHSAEVDSGSAVCGRWSHVHAGARQLCRGKHDQSTLCPACRSTNQNAQIQAPHCHPGKATQAQLPAHSPEAGVSTPPFCTSGLASSSFCCSARHNAASSSMREVPQ